MASRGARKKNSTLLFGAGLLCVIGLLGAVSMVGASRAGFEGDRAFSILKKQCDFGPRPPGTLAHEKLRAYLIQSMKQVSDKTEVQDFTAGSHGAHRMSNIIGVLNPDAKKRVMIAAHWDTRPTADQEKVLADKKKPIMGADDGASGVGVVLELARALKVERPKVCVIFMLFDGEDVGPDVDNMFLGAKYFAKHMGEYRPDRMILLDMIGDSNLNIYKELNSVDSDRDLVQRVWDAASKLGYSSQFPNETKYTIEDDHLPVQQAGVASIDLIDFDYPYWHTLEDTVDKCSPDSLEAVGKTLQEVIKTWPS